MVRCSRIRVTWSERFRIFVSEIEFVWPLSIWCVCVSMPFMSNGSLGSLRFAIKQLVRSTRIDFYCSCCSTKSRIIDKMHTHGQTDITHTMCLHGKQFPTISIARTPYHIEMVNIHATHPADGAMANAKHITSHNSLKNLIYSNELIQWLMDNGHDLFAVVGMQLI